jgi:prepilin-type N-terminal cleavage/methylation domain-containing protein
MKRSVLVSKRAFTLIEVMVAVMIVSIVIAALFKLRGDTNHLFTKIQQEQKGSSYATLLLWNPNYGFTKESINLYRLVDNFDLDDDLRRKLKTIKTKISYEKLKTIDLDTMQLEIGKTDFSVGDFDVTFNRVIQK